MYYGLLGYIMTCKSSGFEGLGFRIQGLRDKGLCFRVQGLRNSGPDCKSLGWV